MTTEEIITQALSNLEKIANLRAEFDIIDQKKIDGCLKITINNKVYFLNAKVNKELRNQKIESLISYNEQFKPFIVLATRISSTIKTQLQKHQIAYLEANGNVYLNMDDCILWIDTNKPIQIEEKFRSRIYTKTGLKVVFEFLNNNKLIHQPYRQIAEVTKTAIGNVTNILKGLKEEGFVLQLNKNEIIFKNKQELLEKWTNAFEYNLKPTLKIGNFKFTDENNFYNWKNIQFVNGLTVWGGEPAADILTNHLRPEKLTLYTSENRNDLMKNYRLVPDRNGNVEIYKKFWNEDSNINNDKNTAPPMVVYADLISSDDKRNRETAKMIYEQYIEQNV